MYFSFRRICSILERLHSVFPRGVSTFRRSRASLIWRRLRPSRNRLKIILMCSASSGTISGSPSSSFLYPSILEYGKANLPWLYPFRLPHLTLLLRDSLSPWAKALVHVKNISLVTREVSNPSFSKRMMIPRPLAFVCMRCIGGCSGKNGTVTWQVSCRFSLFCIA